MLTQDLSITPLDKSKMISEVWTTGFMQMGYMYRDLWRNGQITAKNLVFLNAVREVMVTVYYEAIRLGICDPIEKIPKSDKEALWKICKEHAGELSKKQQVNYCRCLWIMGNLI